MSPAPLPLRLAVGLVVTTVETAAALPLRTRRQLRGLPSAVVTGAARRALRRQQQVSQVLAKGEDAIDQFLTPRRAAPEWATFDDDKDDDKDSGRNSTFLPTETAIRTGYDGTDLDDLPELLDSLDADTISALAEFERAGARRPAFLTLLDNAQAVTSENDGR